VIGSRACDTMRGTCAFSDNTRVSTCYGKKVLRVALQVRYCSCL